MVIALTALTIIFLNERNIRPKINLVKDAEKIKNQIESLKLPKMNPLCGLAPSKMFNKFDMVPRNYAMMPIANTNASINVDVSKCANATTLPNEDNKDNK
jgi:hypothetical protein